jgi:hypothetical protein
LRTELLVAPDQAGLQTEWRPDPGPAGLDQDGVAHELLEQAAVALDLRGEPVERPADHRLHDLGVLPLGELGGPDEVGEQRRGELPLPPRRRRGCPRRGQRRPARRAEPGALEVLEPQVGHVTRTARL